jgi:hypothetical protein
VAGRDLVESVERARIERVSHRSHHSATRDHAR